MECIYVPFLKYGGIIRDLNASEEKMTYERDRSRVENIKKMIEMKQSQLLMPSRSHNYDQHYDQHYDQTHNLDRNRNDNQSYSPNQSGGYGNTESQIDITDCYVLAGSEYLEPKAKPYLTPSESRRAKKDLEDALKTDMFKVWPVYENTEEEAGGKDGKGKGEDKKKNNKKTGNTKESGLLVALGTAPGIEKGRREAIAREWHAKEERDVTGRARVAGGYEDLVEMEQLRSMDGFAPTLLGVRVEDYQRGQDTDEEDEVEEWRIVRRSKRMEPVIRREDGEMVRWRNGSGM